MDRRTRFAAIATLGFVGGLLIGPEAAVAAPRCFGKRPDIVGTSGRDRLAGTPGRDVIVGLGGNDRIAGGGGIDLLCGGAGNDAIGGHGAQDKIAGGGGGDSLFGGPHGDLLKGNGGDDFLFGETGNDRFFGHGGDDVLVGQQGNDRLNGGPGDDLASFFFSRSGATASLLLTGPQPTGEGSDQLRSIEGLEGTRFLDTFTGDARINFFYLYQGNDVVDGGPNFDLVSFFASNNPVMIDLPNDQANGEGTDSLVNIEDAAGSAEGDQIIGDDGSNFLFGLAGRDTINAAGDDDLLNGGRNFDTGDGGLEGPDGDLCISIEADTECEVFAEAARRSAAARSPGAREVGASVHGVSAVSTLEQPERPRPEEAA